MVISKQVLVMLAWLQAAATDGSTSSEQSCEGDDGSAYLQHFAKESSAYLALLSGNRSDPCITDINTGLCGNGQCTGCTPSTPTIIPTTGTGFDEEELECIGTLTTCKATGGSTTPLSGDYYEFLNPIDQLVCRAQDSGGSVGSQVCYDKWNIDNVAAVCCSAGGESDQVCYNSWFLLSTVDTRVHDVCCDGLQTCYQVTFQNVNSLSCRGNNVCQNSIGETDISSNLYCDGESIANTKSVDPMDACYQFPITFGKNAASSHCITCKRDEVCRDSDWTFPNGGNVNMLCTDLPASGKKNCRNLNLIFEANGCVELNCEGSTSVSGTLPCNLLAVLKSDTTNPTVSCKCTGICDGLATTTDKEGYSIVTCNSETTCGVTCGTDDTACCKAEAGVNGGHPRCGTGFCTTSTTTPGGDVPSTSTGGEVGDPHIDTFDGQHYTLLKQGSFSFWRFSGSDAEIVSAKNQALLKKLPVDFKIYTHYSGHTSYTKGLLLVDSSGATTPQRALELTSKDCTWRTKTKDTEWSAVEKPQLLSIPDADGDEMTAFRMMKPLHGQKMYVELLMKKADGGFKKIGNLYAHCKPGHHINMKIAMSSKEDIGLVQGQVGIHGHTAAGEDHKASLLQGTQRMRSDSEFAISEKWTDLGGSGAAATYLSMVDEEGPAAFLKDCTGQERIEAKAMCKKYLGEPPTRSGDLHSFENRFDNCVFDVCNGGGEVAAEMAAEIFHAE